MRRDERPRVLGPYWREDKRLWRVTTVDPGAAAPQGRKRDGYFATKQEAEDFIELKLAELARLEGVSIGAAIEAYTKYLEEKGTVEVSRKETARRLRAFFPDHDALVSRIDAEKAKSYYEAFRQRLRPDKQPISVDYHRSTLINTRSMFTWIIEERGWVKVNPFAGVRGIGRRSAGKVQHTGDEVRKFYDHCLALAQAGDQGALGALMALLMALRSGDVTRRVVRDVDLDATVLRVSAGKTSKSNRPRRVPEVLQPLLRRLVAGRGPFEPLFPTPYTESGHHTRRWLEEAMVRLCRGAGVPYVCPHALKGTAGTLLAETGAAADVIADHLSHSEAATSKRHYVEGGVMEAAQARRALAVIQGGRG